jgi:outer membrane protein insertion porin family
MTLCQSGLRPWPATSRSIRPVAVIALIAFGLIGSIGTAAPTDGPEGKTISEIRINGIDSITENQVRAKLLSRQGRPLDSDLIDTDLKSLKQTNWFSQVNVSYLPDEQSDGVILIFKVREMPIIKSVEYRGRSKITVKTIEQNTGIKVGARADYVRTAASVGQIRRLYEEKGYLLAEVKLLKGGKEGDREVIYEILEGPRHRVREIEFRGNEVYSDATLRTKIESGTRFGLGGKFNTDSPENDARKVVLAYQEIGYVECVCTPVVLQNDGLGQVKLRFDISEGPLYSVRNISFEGNKKFTAEELKNVMVMHSGQPLREDVKSKDFKTLLGKYSAIGCIEINIQAEPVYTDTPGVVDLVYRIEEGDQFTLGAINVHGNDRTKSKVILREMSAAGLLPGEPLDGTRIETAKKRLDNLPYFVKDPQMGKPTEIQIVHKRGPDQKYAGATIQDLSNLGEVIQARYQSPDDPPAIPPTLPPLPADEPLAPGAGGGVVPFGSGGTFEPAPGDVPAIVVPPPVRRGRGSGTPAFTPPNESPTGTFPPLPGGNLSDVGPDINEPFTNRSFSNIATQVEPKGRSYADLDVNVDEAPTGRIMLGVGATSFGGLSGNFIVHERNFDLFNLPRSPREIFNGQAFRGAGQDFRIELSPGTLINRALVSFREPSLFDRGITLDISGYTFSRFYPYYNEARGGGRFSLGKQFGTQTYADVAARVEDVSVSGFTTPAAADFYAAAGHTFLATLKPRLFFDTRNDPYLPSQGSYFETAFEQAWGDFTFPKFTAEARRHFTIRSRPDNTGKHILSMRGFFGISGRDTPVYERFYAGDFRSMRGFAYRGVGPFVLGANVGGIMTMIGSVEYQFPLTANDRFQMVVFSDFGTVENSYDIQNFRASIGTGLRVVVPALGPLPLAFDIAFPLAKGPDDKEKTFSFFIGAFY